jgi:anti-sigma factor RsiW
MDCNEARMHFLDRRRGTLPEALRAAFEEHLDSCTHCRHERSADDLLSTLLESRLPRRRAPDRLRHALRARWERPAWRMSAASLSRTVPAMAAGAAVALLAVFAWRAPAPEGGMVTEAVNDHLRVLYSERPLGVESGGIHQVKPWFEGRIDFAPVVPFEGDDDFSLQGGAVAYFLDRKAATFVYKRRLHVVTLLVFRAEGMSWPTMALRPVGDARGTLTTSRGFHVLLWRNADLGYALVSDVDEHDLMALGTRIAR